MIDRPLLMGILNVTPDSFSDGGKHADQRVAFQAGVQMVEDGADVIDVGGESTRPGAMPLPADEELDRIFKVVIALSSLKCRISVDTNKSSVASWCLSRGIWMINDVTAFGDPEMAKVCAEAKCQVCLMHMQGTPQTMQQNPTYLDVVGEVRDYLLERAAYAESEGVPRDNIWIDPGFGFGKTYEHNLELLRNLRAFVETGYKVLIGVSRKGFLGRLGNLNGDPLPVGERLEATLVTQALAQMSGVHCIRTHDVAAARRVIEMVSMVKPSRV